MLQSDPIAPQTTQQEAVMLSNLVVAGPFFIALVGVAAVAVRAAVETITGK